MVSSVKIHGGFVFVLNPSEYNPEFSKVNPKLERQLEDIRKQHKRKIKDDPELLKYMIQRHKHKMLKHILKYNKFSAKTILILLVEAIIVDSFPVGFPGSLPEENLVYDNYVIYKVKRNTKKELFVIDEQLYYKVRNAIRLTAQKHPHLLKFLPLDKKIDYVKEYPDNAEHFINLGYKVTSIKDETEYERLLSVCSSRSHYKLKFQLYKLQYNREIKTNRSKKLLIKPSNLLDINFKWPAAHFK